MNLNFSELERTNKFNEFIYDDITPNNEESNVKIIDTNQHHNLYYSPLENKLTQQNSIFNATLQPKQKSKITYDDMLNSMNVTVVNGVLRFGIDSDKIKNNMSQNNPNINGNKNMNYNIEHKVLSAKEEKKQVPINSQSFIYNDTQKQNKSQNQKIKNETLDPNVKNSWIYNKYFKHYKEESQDSIPERPLTKKEMDEKTVREFLERKHAQKMASQIKSTKLLFSNNNQVIYSSQNNNLNKLFRFK